MNQSIRRQAAAVILSLYLFFILCSTVGFADAEMRRIVVGADLTEEQVLSVYAEFGIRRGDIPELKLTNAEEHAALDGYVDAAIIGTRSMSCVFLELLGQGSGMNVTVKNISWCTPEMYINALSTAGITDARIAVAAPFAVSGTAALAGIYKAYEDMTGQKLDAAAKDVSTQELTITGELANEIGSEDSTSIVNDLKLMLNETDNMSDEELRSKKILFVCGGVGTAPVYPQVKWLNAHGVKADVIIGCRTHDLLFYEDKMRDVAGNLYVTTDDGSYMHKGVVTTVIDELVAEGKHYDLCVAIGPMIMMKFCTLTTKKYEIPTIVSMNPIMVDGTGMCGACRLTVGDEVKFACVDGPEFDGFKINWNECMKRMQMYKTEEGRAKLAYEEGETHHGGCGHCDGGDK